MSNRHVINMANSIVGVSILSMPYCFKETGIVLGVLLILISGFITKKTCMFLINSAIMSRRRSYELLAFHVFGLPGKLFMELCMILFLMGICVSFHVVMGDLAPALAAKYFVIENSSSLRATLLIGMVALVILPLCLLRNLDSLASMSACSIGFYVVLNGIIFMAALDRLLDGSWIKGANLFRFENTFRVLPIMTLALACQSNVFEIYYSIPDPDVERMETVVHQAVNLCVALYTGVGFLGYVAFVDKDIGGNVIMNFPNSSLTDGITLVFVITLAISFPLILFPCRTSLHSLLYKRNTQNSFDMVNFIPESRFKLITLGVLLISLIIGIMLPSIEFVLGLLGSTMGMVIAMILPSIFYIKVQSKRSFERLLAQGFLIIAVILMVAGTSLHLSGMQTSTEIKPIVEKAGVFKSPIIQPLQLRNVVLSKEPPKEEIKVVDLTGRKEPAIPEPPAIDVKKNVVDKQALDAESKSKFEIAKENAINAVVPVIPIKADPPKKTLDDVKEVDLHLEKNVKVDEILNPDAIRKEEKEMDSEILPEEKKHVELESKQEKILKEMQHQQKEQKQLIKEQKEIIKELKIQKDKIQVMESNLEAQEEEAPKEKMVAQLADTVKHVAEELVRQPPPQEIVNEKIDAAKKAIEELRELVPQDTVNKELVPQDNVNKELVHKDNVNKELVPQDNVNKELVPKDNANKEFELLKRELPYPQEKLVLEDAPRMNQIPMFKNEQKPSMDPMKQKFVAPVKSNDPQSDVVNKMEAKPNVAKPLSVENIQPMSIRRPEKKVRKNKISATDMKYNKPMALKNERSHLEDAEAGKKHDEERRKRDTRFLPSKKNMEEVEKDANEVKTPLEGVKSSENEVIKTLLNNSKSGAKEIKTNVDEGRNGGEKVIKTALNDGISGENALNEGMSGEKALYEGKSGEKALNEGKSGEKALNEGKSGEKAFNEGKSGEKAFNEGKSGEKAFNEGKSGENNILMSDSLSLNEIVNEKSNKFLGIENKLIGEKPVLKDIKQNLDYQHESRHLLWNNYNKASIKPSIGRRKRPRNKNNDNPDYWDEM